MKIKLLTILSIMTFASTSYGMLPQAGNQVSRFTRKCICQKLHKRFLTTENKFAHEAPVKKDVIDDPTIKIDKLVTKIDQLVTRIDEEKINKERFLKNVGIGAFVGFVSAAILNFSRD